MATARASRSKRADGVVGDARRQHLDGDLAHAAFAQQLQHFVLQQAVAGSEPATVTVGIRHRPGCA